MFANNLCPTPSANHRHKQNLSVVCVCVCVYPPGDFVCSKTHTHAPPPGLSLVWSRLSGSGPGHPVQTQPLWSVWYWVTQVQHETLIIATVWCGPHTDMLWYDGFIRWLHTHTKYTHAHVSLCVFEQRDTHTHSHSRDWKKQRNPTHVCDGRKRDFSNI